MMELESGEGKSNCNCINDAKNQRRVGLIYDQRMCKHRTPDNDYHPKNPNRITVIWNKLKLAGIPQRCVLLKAKEAEDKYICAVHSKNHVNLIRNISSKQYDSKRNQIASKLNSIYFNEGSSESAYLAAGSVVEVAEKVARGELDSAFTIVRPPGHHAEYNEAMGFCLFNNVAIAASFLLDEKPKLGINKILVVDWDVHHGNGTQKAFWKDPRVLFFSVHRHEFGSFFPANDDGFYTMVGEGPGAGYNINVPWENDRCGDADYLAVWDHILVPVAKEFNPDIIIISAGFDAAVGDPLGRCQVTPYGYSVMLKKLMDFAQGRIVLALEGGYNLDSIANSALACIIPLHLLSGVNHAFFFLLFTLVRRKVNAFWPTLADELPTKLTNPKAPPHTLLSSSESNDEDDEASKFVSEDLVSAVKDVVGPILKLKVEDNHGNMDGSGISFYDLARYGHGRAPSQKGGQGDQRSSGSFTRGQSSGRQVPAGDRATTASDRPSTIAINRREPSFYVPSPSVLLDGSDSEDHVPLIHRRGKSVMEELDYAPYRTRPKVDFDDIFAAHVGQELVVSCMQLVAQLVGVADYAEHITANHSGEIKKLKGELKKSEAEKSNVVYAQKIAESARVVVVHAMEEANAARDDAIVRANSLEFERGVDTTPG
ncbi:hypothetical protein CRYUN_Cryun07bG0037300 [Craigia yunnanensis]